MDSEGETALIIAAIYNQEKVCEFLLENNANIDVQNKYGNTALIFASIYGYLNVVRKLLENGANFHIENCNKKTAYDLAKTLEIKELISSYGSNDFILKKKYLYHCNFIFFNN